MARTAAIGTLVPWRVLASSSGNCVTFPVWERLAVREELTLLGSRRGQPGGSRYPPLPTPLSLAGGAGKQK